MNKVEYIPEDFRTLLNATQIPYECSQLKHKLAKNTTNENVPQLILHFITSIKIKHIGGLANKELNKFLECYILSILHDTVILGFYETFKIEDELIYKKCLLLQSLTFSKNFKNMHHPASIVELASLDCHKTVHHKKVCLSSCYDLIFAEIKFAIAQLSVEKDEDLTAKAVSIPAVENLDIVQLLVEVIIRAKCQHLYSNLYFIQSLSEQHLNEDESFKHILLCFNAAIEILFDADEKSQVYGRTCSEIDISEYSDMVQKLDDAIFCNNFERLSIKRIIKQISKSHEC